MDPKNVRALLDAQDWGDVYSRLFDFALKRCTTKTKVPQEIRAEAKDLAQEAITRVFAYDSKWDPEKEPDLTRYLMSVVNSLRANERTSAASQRNISLGRKRTKAAAEAVADTHALPEEVVVNTDLFARRIELLNERLVGDADALRLFELMTSGLDKPADLRKATKWSANELMAVRRRVLRAAATVARDIGGGEHEEPFPEPDDDDDDGGGVV
jgi:DNA-directed RNA polymerase specialized sigma24 family protein